MRRPTSPLGHGALTGALTCTVVGLAGACALVAMGWMYGTPDGTVNLSGTQAAVALVGVMGVLLCVPAGIAAGVTAGLLRRRLLRQRSTLQQAATAGSNAGSGNRAVFRTQKSPTLLRWGLALFAATFVLPFLGLGALALVTFLATMAVFLFHLFLSRQSAAAKAQLARYAASWDGTPTAPDTHTGEMPGMWEQCGAALMARSAEMTDWASGRSTVCVPLDQQMMLDPVRGNPLLVDASQLMSQTCNVITITSSDGTATVGDLNYITHITVNGVRRYAVHPSTFAWTDFPAQHVLVVTPKSVRDNGTWQLVGEESGTGEPTFDARFTLVSTDPRWAQLVLNPAVKATLLSLPDVRLVIDQGRITLCTTETWVEGPHLADFVDLLAQLRFSVKAAQQSP